MRNLRKGMIVGAASIGLVFTSPAVSQAAPADADGFSFGWQHCNTDSSVAGDWWVQVINQNGTSGAAVYLFPGKLSYADTTTGGALQMNIVPGLTAVNLKKVPGAAWSTAVIRKNGNVYALRQFFAGDCPAT